LTRQETELTTLKKELETADQALLLAEKASNTLSLQIGRLETSLKRLEREVRIWKIGLVTTAVVGLASSIFFAIR